ncbi:MAG: branched-chain amino acid ABC transporter permease [Bacillota bacterium]
MAALLQAVLNGLALGSFYGLVGIGLAVTFGLWGILNLAQGEFMVLGGYLVWMLLGTLHLPLPFAAPVGIVCTGLLMALVARGTFHFTQRDLVNGFIISSGLSLVIQNGLELAVTGAAREIHVPSLGSLRVFGASIPVLRCLFIGLSVVSLAAALWILGRTRIGRQIRAAACNIDGAKFVGVNADRVEAASYVFSGMLAALAGVGLGVLFVLTPYLGARYVLKGFAAVLLGGAYRGLGNITSTFVAGLAIGLVESVGTALTAAQWQDLFAYALLYAGLLVASKAGR